MTFEEARAQFPVLERYAYLNAGTNGPLARATVEAVTTQAERELREGRSGRPQFDAMLEQREIARRELAAVIGVDPALVALVDSTTRGCGVVMTGLGLGPEDEIVITDQEHFGLTGPVHASGARHRRRAGGRGRDPRGGDAADEAARDVARALDDRPAARPRASEGGERPAAARRRRAVGGRDPGRRGAVRLLHRLRAEVAVRAGADRRALRP